MISLKETTAWPTTRWRAILSSTEMFSDAGYTVADKGTDH